jgi:hypothetical protein
MASCKTPFLLKKVWGSVLLPSFFFGVLMIDLLITSVKSSLFIPKLKPLIGLRYRDKEGYESLCWIYSLASFVVV